MTTQSRKYQITLNNPVAHGHSRKSIQETIASLNPQYYCMGDEIGKEGTPQTHIFVFRNSPIRFNTLKNKFPDAHIETAYGSCQENRDYITKSGKWLDSDKTETTVKDSFFEFGVMPRKDEENNSTADKIIAGVDAGKSTEQIIRENPKLWAKTNDISVLRETLYTEKYMNQNRNVNVIYVHACINSGRTEYIYARHDPRDICRITNYHRDGSVRFDAYHAHRVLLFEEFRSSIPLVEMINYMSGYPLNLPARYTDRVACYETVYITSTFPLDDQYESEKDMRPETRDIFVRKINRIIEFREDGEIVERSFNGIS